MAAFNPPVELPAYRQSRNFVPTSNIQDPNWIPILNGSSTHRSDVPTPYYDVVPQFPSRGSSRSTAAKDTGDPIRERTRTLSPSELEAGPVHVPNLKQRVYPTAASSQRSTTLSREPSTDSRTLGSNEHTISTRAPSTVGTQSLIDDQVYTIPGNSMPKDDLAFPPVPISTRSSMNSLKRPAVPTSKYSRKPVSSLSTTPVLIPSSPPSQPQTPHESPLIRPATSSEHVSMQSQQYFIPPPIPAEPSVPTIPKLSHAKSTASERKARALHSHPSNSSMRQEMSPSPSTGSFPIPPTHRHRKSTDSRKSSIHDSQPPSAAPQEPLPDLPPQARRPPTRERPPPRERPPTRDKQSPPQLPPEAHISPVSNRHSPPDLQHKELADFMTLKSTVIFRRFDDVHVRLLLSLQDEISALEKELAFLENPARVDGDSERIRIMGELRRLLSDYDHLFANWKLMQASKIDENTSRDLETWLQKSDNGVSTASASAKQDLEWLKSSKDLSSVQIGSKRPRVYSSTNEKAEHTARPRDDGGSKGGGGSGGGFAAFFSSCAGRRK